MSHALDAARVEKNLARIQRPFAITAFMAAKMPLGIPAGLRVDAVDRTSCTVSLPGGWRTQNPFGSMYWAAQGMAAEMATGIQGFVLTNSAPVPVRMILASCEGRFTKMCKGRGRFVFTQGDKVEAAILSTLASGETVPCATDVVGYDSNGDEVSRWVFTWSFRARRG